MMKNEDIEVLKDFGWQGLTELTKQNYNNSLIPLNRSHLRKGILLEYGVQHILRELNIEYTTASTIGEGPDLEIYINKLRVPTEVKNWKKRTITSTDVLHDVISRFKLYSKAIPKLLIISRSNFTAHAKRLLQEYNINILELSRDFNTLQQLKEALYSIKQALQKALNTIFKLSSKPKLTASGERGICYVLTANYTFLQHIYGKTRAHA